ncbi:MAG: YbaN family protein [Microbacteriaceae bacterium]|nr:YbaN family protein [Microbacteriaceae bacterium]
MAGRHLLFAGVGVAATGLAVAGIWVPGLPTTPFVIVALWAFARSSERLSAWLRGIPLLRSAIEAADRYGRERTLPLWVKVVSQSAAWASAVIVLLVTGSVWIALPVAAGAVACSVFMFATPTRRPSDSAQDQPRR